jgi:hypothetical protein
MKTSSLLLIVICFISTVSCEQKESKLSKVDTTLLTGGWNLEEVTFNSIDGTEINEWISNSTVLHLDEDQTYYRNYVSGKWSLEDKKLILNPADDSKFYYWEYGIITLSKTKLEVRIELTESQYCCDFEQFEDDEIITITETYTKSE